MNVESPITSVIPTLDGRVLEVAAASTIPLSLTEIHRRSTAGTLSGIRKVLIRLVGEGVLFRQPGGYVLNRDHIAVPAITALTSMRSVFFARLRSEVASWEWHPDLLGIFGSFARRSGDSQSDIDILLISPHGCPDELRDRLCLRITAWTGNRVQVFDLTPSDVLRMQGQDEPLLDNWRRDLEIVMGQDSAPWEALR